MKKMTKFAALLMALVLAMGSMTACGGNSDSDSDATKAPTTTAGAGEEGGETGEKTPVTLKVWTPSEEQNGDFGDEYGDNLLQYMVDTFNENQTKWDLTIEAEVCGEDVAKETLQKDPEAGADVFMYAGDQALELQKNGILYELEGDAVEEVKASNPAAAIEGATLEDEELGESFLYGIPFTPNQWFMYYDTSKLSEEEIKSLDTIMAKDIEGCNYNFAMPIDNSWYVQSFFYAAGCQLFPDGDETICTFNDENGVAAADYMIDLVNNKKFLRDDASQNVGISYFKEGTLAAWCGGSWNAAAVKKALGDNYGAAALPTIKLENGVEENLMPFADYKYIGVNTNCAEEKKEAAVDFAAWLGGEQCQKDRYIARGVIPTNTSVVEDEEVKSDPIVVALANQADKLGARGQTTQMNNYWTPAEAFGTGVYNKEITKDNVKEKLDAMVSSMLEKVAE